MKLIKNALALAALVAVMAPASAAITVLDFEGVGDNNAVGNFYNGGAGTNYGVSFSGPTLAKIDQDAGGSGNFANEPSPNTVMFFRTADNAILDVAAGFETGFSFFYTSSTAATVTVWSGLGGAGTLLGSLNLAAQYDDGCSGDPWGDFCNWSTSGLAFDGVAQSINFGGTASQTAYDNITFGSSVPAIPEPETYALMLAGLGLVGFMARRRKAK